MKMKNHFVWVCLCSMTICQQALAQAPALAKKNNFRVGVGMEYFKTLDLQYSPNVYQSLKPNLNLAFTRSTGKAIFNVDLHAAMGPIRPAGRSVQTIYITDTNFYGEDGVEATKLDFSQMGFNFELGYLHAIPAANRLNVMIGGSLVENFTYTAAIIYPGTINYVSMNAKARVDFPLNNGKSLSVGLAFPILSLVTRMPYHNSPVFPDKSNLQAFFTGHNTLETVNHFQNPSCYLKYNWYSGKMITMDIMLEASWMHYTQPENLSTAGSRLSIGVNF